jgi:Flp pilus assembly protein TadD
VNAGGFKTVFVSLAAVVAVLLAVEGALRLAGAGFEPRFFLRGEDGFLHANRNFGRLFFPERLVREGVAVRLADPKPDNTYRIFILGESAAMGFPSPRFGFVRVLERMLREAFPGKNIEVVNVAMAGINSHAIRLIARECAALEPNAYVIYMGNNEVVGPFGPGTVFGGSTTSLWRARAAMALRSTKTGQLIDGWMDRWAGRDRKRWGGMEMFTSQRVAADHPAMPDVYANFRRNLDDIISITAGKPTVLCTVAVNLTNFPPLAGDKARTIFSAAQTAAASGDEEKARRFFREARDLDELRFRADSAINRIIREHPKGSDVTLIDAEEIFATNQDGLTDSALFWEHVHLDFAGNFLLAENVAEALMPRMAEFFGEQARALPAPEAVRRKIGYTESEELYAAGDIAGMLANPPFRDQPGNAQRGRAMGERARKLDAAWKSADLEAWQKDLEAEVARYPQDPWQRVALASIMDARGDAAGALAQKRKIATLIPYDATALLNLGRAEAASGNLTAAKDAFRRAAQLDPHFAKPAIELAACAMRENNPREAQQVLEEFLLRDSESVEAHLALSQIARYEKRLLDARTHLQKAAQIDPSNAAVLAELEGLGAAPPH